MLCRTEFGFWIRRHHCRRCGAVVCDGCSSSRTKFIYKEISPKQLAEEDCRVCDACIQVIDETLALSVSRRLDKRVGAAFKSQGASGDQQLKEQEKAAPLEPDKAGNRTVMTVGRYRAEIKESEGNRYIRDPDL
uniref:FYVE-type domain-containing protein n=1 Tax=Hyaloperonospora arabidopsidis (strain Emoy2) TaxID=559515 RepID=M4B2K7_HYAAE